MEIYNLFPKTPSNYPLVLLRYINPNFSNSPGTTRFSRITHRKLNSIEIFLDITDADLHCLACTLPSAPVGGAS